MTEEEIRKQIKFHQGEATRFKAMLAKNKEMAQVELRNEKNLLNESSATHSVRVGIASDIRQIYEFLKQEKSFMNTKELCDLLNESLDRHPTAKENVTTTDFGRYWPQMKSDGRFVRRKVEGAHGMIWEIGLEEWFIGDHPIVIGVEKI